VWWQRTKEVTTVGTCFHKSSKKAWLKGCGDAGEETGKKLPKGGAQGMGGHRGGKKLSLLGENVKLLAGLQRP